MASYSKAQKLKESALKDFGKQIWTVDKGNHILKIDHIIENISV
jgi:hypothetical protein